MSSSIFKRISLMLVAFSFVVQTTGVETHCLSPRSIWAHSVNWGSGVSRSIADQTIRSLDNEQKWIPLIEGIPHESKELELALAHLQFLKKIIPAILELLNEGNGEKIEHFFRKLREYLLLVHPNRFEIHNEKHLKILLEDLLDQLFTGVRLYLSESEKIPGIYPHSTAVNPNIPVPVDDPDAFLLETVRHHTVDGDKIITVTEGGGLYIGDRLQGFVKRDLLIFEGQRKFSDMGNPAFHTIRGPDGKLYTLLHKNSLSRYAYWSPFGLNQVVFLKGERIGNHPKYIEVDERRFIYFYVYDSGGTEQRRVIRLDSSGKGKFNGNPVYFHPDKNIGYPRLKILDDKLYLYKVVSIENLAENIIVYSTGSEDDDTLHLLPYKRTLYHSGGIIELQNRQQVGPTVYLSRFLHGLFEDLLYSMAFQGAAFNIKGINQKAHDVADALDGVIEDSWGEDFGKTEDSLRSYFNLSKEIERLRVTPHPVFGSRMELTKQNLTRVVKAILISYGNHYGLGLSVNKLVALLLTSGNEGGLFLLDPSLRQSVYATAERAFNQIESESKGQIGRLNVNGSSYFYHFTGFSDIKISNKKVMTEIFEWIEFINRLPVPENFQLSNEAKKGFLNLRKAILKLKKPNDVKLAALLVQKQILNYSRMAWYDKYRPLAWEYFSILKALNISEYLNNLHHSGIPEDIQLEIYLLHAESEYRENFYVFFKKIRSRIIQGLEESKAWPGKAIQYLIIKDLEKKRAAEVLALAALVYKKMPKLLEKVIEEKEIVLKVWQNRSDALIDRALYRLYSETELNHPDGVAFLAELLQNPTKETLPVIRKLGEIFERSRFEFYQIKDPVKMNLLRENTIKELATKIFHPEPEVRHEAMLALKKMDAPEEVLPPVLRIFRIVKITRNIDEKYYEFFQQQLDRFMEQTVKRNKYHKPVMYETMPDIGLIAAEVVQQAFSNTNEVNIETMVDEVLDLGSIDLTQEPFRLLEIQQDVMRAFVFLSQRYRLDSRTIKINLDTESDLDDLMDAFMEEKGGVYSISSLADFFDEHASYKFEIKDLYLTVNQMIKEKFPKRVDYWYMQDYYCGFSEPVTDFPPVLYKHLREVFNPYNTLMIREMTLNEIHELLLVYLRHQRDHSARLCVEILVAAIISDQIPVKLKVKALQYLKSVYTAFRNLEPIFPNELKKELDFLIENNGLRKQVDETDLFIFLSSYSMADFKVRYQAQETLKETVLWYPKSVSYKLIFKNYIRLLKDSVVSLAALLNLREIQEFALSINGNTSQNTVLDEYKRVLTSKDAFPFFLKVIERGDIGELQLLMLIDSEFSVLEFKDIHAFLNALKTERISVRVMRRLLRKALIGKETHFEAAAGLLGEFSDKALNEAYEDFFTLEYLPSISRYTSFIILVNRLLSQDHPHPETLARVIRKALEPLKPVKPVEKAYRLNKEVTMRLTQQDHVWLIQGEIQQKNLLKAEILHEFLHILFSIRLGNNWSPVLEEAFLKKYPFLSSLWHKGKTLYSEESGYPPEELTEEWMIKVLEIHLLNQNGNYFQNKRLDQIFSKIDPFIIHFFTEFEDPYIKELFVSQRPVKQRLIRLYRYLKPFGLSFNLYQTLLNSHCEPPQSPIESAI